MQLTEESSNVSQQLYIKSDASNLRLIQFNNKNTNKLDSEDTIYEKVV